MKDLPRAMHVNLTCKRHASKWRIRACLMVFIQAHVHVCACVRVVWFCGGGGRGRRYSRLAFASMRPVKV